MDARRGYVPEDERNFSPESITVLRTASRHVAYLINEGYGLKQAATFVGNHFLLSERQRLAIMRSLATDKQLKERKDKEIPFCGISGESVWIDGFNTVITLEVMLCGSILLECMDGTVRDLAGLRGTYRLIPETGEAIRLMLTALRDAGAGRVNILLDEPVSNSGRLKARIADIAEEFPFDLDIRILREVDQELFGKDSVITSDSIILDRCSSWTILVAGCLALRKVCTVRVW